MSEDPLRAFGNTYGIDMRYDFRNDGTVDLLIDESGDIRLVGGTVTELIEVRRQNAIQQIILRLLTPKDFLSDEKRNVFPFGSDLHSLVGNKDTDLNKLAVRAYVISCLQDYVWLEMITRIDVEFLTSGVLQITLGIKLIDDSEIIEEIITLGG